MEQQIYNLQQEFYQLKRELEIRITQLETQCSIAYEQIEALKQEIANLNK